MSEHTEDCAADGGGECQAVYGQWLQPESYWVERAKEELPDDAPWCRIQELSWELAGQN